MTRVGCCVAVWLLLAPILPAQERSDKLRSHRDGPLSKADFRGKPDPESRFAAWTEASIRFHFEYRFETVNGQTVVTLKEIDVWSVLETEKSWNLRPQSPLLLDHEQGHFDLTEIQARTARNALQALIRKRDPMTRARGRRETEARSKLQRAIEAFIEPYSAAAIENNKAYDAATNSGRDAAAQATARRAQQEELEKLARQWEALDQ